MPHLAAFHFGLPCLQKNLCKSFHYTKGFLNPDMIETLLTGTWLNKKSLRDIVLIRLLIYEQADMG